MAPSGLVPGDVIRIFDRWTHPPKPKRHICICTTRQFFLRINSKEVYKPCHLLRQANNSFLEKDSYVELTQLVRHYAYEIPKAEILGRLSAAEAKLLVTAVEAAETLNEEHKRLIATQLATLFDTR
jgi:hypothetical protein